MFFITSCFNSNESESSAVSDTKELKSAFKFYPDENVSLHTSIEYFVTAHRLLSDVEISLVLSILSMIIV